MKPDRNQILLGILAFIWMAAGTAYYFVNHKPFSPSTALILGMGIYNLVTALLLTSLAGAVGRWVTRWVRGNMWIGRLLGPAGATRPGQPEKPISLGPGVQLVLEAALGFGCLALVFLLVGFTLGVSRLVVWAATLILIVILRKDLGQWIRQWRGLGGLRARQPSLVNSLVIALALIFFLTLLVALAPPVKFDSLVYHLTIPRLYLAEGRLYYPPENMFWGMPQTVELLYTWAMGLAGPPAAVTLSWVMAGLSVIGVVGLVSGVYRSQIGWAVGAILLSGYSLAISTSWGYVDWGVFLFGFGFFAWLLLWRKTSERTALLLAGLMAGMALGIKYTAGLLLPIGFLVVLIQTRERTNILRSLLIFGVPAVVVLLPWWGKNLLATGNPFYPLLIPGGEMDPARLAFYQDHHPWGGWLDVVLLPARATYLGLEGGPGYGASIGPFFLVFGVLAFFRWRTVPEDERDLIRIAGLVAGLGVLGWIIASRSSGLLTQTRLYLAVFPALAFLAGAGLNRISQLQIPEVRLGRIALILISVVLWLNVLQVAGRTLQMGSPGFHFGLVEPQRYLEDNLGWYARAMETLRSLPEGDRAVLLWEPRGYYCNPKCDSDEVLDRWVHKMRIGSTPDTVGSEWTAAGYTHLLVYRAGADFIRQDDNRYANTEWEALDLFLDGLPLQEDFGGTYELYQLQP